MAFVVVVFTKTEEVSIVPKNWLIGQNSCLWPNFSNEQRLDKAIKKKIEPENDWKMFDIRILKSTDDFMKAKKYLKRSEEESTFSSTEDELSQRRNRKPNKRYIQPSSSSDTDDTNDVDVALDLLEGGKQDDSNLNHFPTPPNVLKSKALTPSANRDNSNLNPFPTQPNVLKSKALTPSANRDNSNLNPFPIQAQPNVLKSKALTPSAKIRTITSPSPSASPQCKEGHPELPATFYHEMKHIIMDNNRLLQILLNQQTGIQDNFQDVPDDILSLLPLLSRETMEQFERHAVHSKTSSSALSRFLSIAGGETVKSCVFRIMRKLMSNQLALLYNWKGHGAKDSFESSPLVLIIKNAVRLNTLTSKATDLEIENNLKQWLRTSMDRNGGRRERARRSLLRSDE